MKYILNLLYPDSTGVVQAFGPYDSVAAAEEVRTRLSKWPAILNNHPRNWSVDPVAATSGSPGQDVRDELGWDDATAASVRARFAAGEACQHCKGLHARACPRVKTMSFHPNGGLAGIEFWPDGQWPDTHVIWPEEVPIPEETP